jgi:hypothetical protein
MSSDLPPPLTPSDCDLRDLDGFMLNVERLLASELWALATGDELKAALSLWCRAWKQVPAASLPDDEGVLAGFAGVSKRYFEAHRIIMRGFTKCSDGRFYHATLSADANRAWIKKQRYTVIRARDAERLRGWREKQNGSMDESDETPYETPSETRFVGVVQGHVQGQVHKKGEGERVPRGEKEPVAPRAPKEPVRPREQKPVCTTPQPSDASPNGSAKRTDRGTRLAAEWKPGEKERKFALSLSLDLDAVTEDFRDYWLARPGTAATSLDWSMTWRRWCRKAAQQESRRPAARKAAAPDWWAG